VEGDNWAGYEADFPEFLTERYAAGGKVRVVEKAWATGAKWEGRVGWIGKGQQAI